MFIKNVFIIAYYSWIIYLEGNVFINIVNI